jgi:hypothetical protein
MCGFKGVGAWRWKMACRTLLGSISEITAGMLESATSRALANIRGDRASHKYSLCWCAGQRQGWSCAGTVLQCQDWIQRQIGQKSFSCRKDKKALAKLNPEKGCYLAA